MGGYGGGGRSRGAGGRSRGGGGGQGGPGAGGRVLLLPEACQGSSLVSGVTHSFIFKCDWRSHSNFTRGCGSVWALPSSRLRICACPCIFLGV